MQDDIEQFNEMVANCYNVFIGTKRSINIIKQAFESIGKPMNPNTVFYEVSSNKKTNGKLLLIEDKDLKIEILQHLHIL